MTTLERILNAPGLRTSFGTLAKGDLTRVVNGLVLIDRLDALGKAPGDSLAILTNSASDEAESYRLDMALRLATSREMAALVFTDARDTIPPTAIAIAERGGLTVLRLDGEVDLARLLIELDHELVGGAAARLARIETALDSLTDAECRQARVDELLQLGGDTIGVRLELREPRPGDIAAHVIGHGDTEGAVCTSSDTIGDGPMANIVVHLVAGAIGRTIDATRRSEDIPLRSRGVMLAQFLLAGPDRADRLLDRLRAADIAIDGWHTVIRLEVDQQPGGGPSDELVPIELSERVGRLALAEARGSGGIWNLTQIGTALLLIRLDGRVRKEHDGAETTALARRVVTRLEHRMPGLVVFCGVGTTHPGPTGLRASAAEAHTATSAARAMRRVNSPVSFDEVGLRRTLIEWYASDAAREAVDAILEPLDRLGGQRKDVAIETLGSYLDNQSSLARTAKDLNLHRNAVAYRVRWIFETLRADPEDPETRLMLQLACRARSLV